MIVELISTGTELLLGQIINTNVAFLAKQLNSLGFNVLFQSVVGDNRDRMGQVINTAISRADIIITSGGLGPTQGDITKEITARMLNRSLILHEPSLEKIKTYFSHRQINMPENNKRQAMIPEGALVIDNERGTAPGIICEYDNKVIINLPGPPHELEWMFSHSIAPYLVKKFGIQGVIVSKVLHVSGIGESSLEEEIKEFIVAQDNPTIALLVKKGEIQVRLTAKAAGQEQAIALISKLEERIRQRVGQYIFAVDDETMESVVGELLKKKKLSIAIAESCTGGLVSSRVTDIAGSSDYLIGSIVCYSNQIKVDEVGVPFQIITDYGAVSEETAKAMAIGIRNKFKADIGVGITGIAGPGGATDTKPVGLVYVAIDGVNDLDCVKYNFSGERTNIKYRTSQAALDIIRRYTLTIGGSNIER
ncbi:putative competence-damage inducible protein [bioreactor metagenome]|uniref:Putative competence-damage inducible protein n=1 Tax=bioreactor metagenome TaxID=1076179 RepID=A0A644T164_9ZZZZ|nr:competence/damage-inducible protein A [Negativicutes bacterium]